MVASLFVFVTLISFPSHAGASASCSSGDEQSITRISASKGSVTHTHPKAAKEHVSQWQGKSLFQVRQGRKLAKAVVFEEDDEDDKKHHEKPDAKSLPAATKAGSPPAKVFAVEESVAAAPRPPGMVAAAPRSPGIWDDLEQFLSTQERIKKQQSKDDALGMLSVKYDIDHDPAKPLQDKTEESVAKARDFNLRPAETLWPNKP